MLSTYTKYFTFDNDFFIQNDGLAMGSPLSGLLADIYLNYFENANIIDYSKIRSLFTADTLMIHLWYLTELEGK